MNLLKKLNRGAILMTGVIIAVIIYLIIHAAVNLAQTEQVKAVCAEYVAAEVRYSVLPAAYRSDTQSMPASEQDNYIQEMIDHIRPLLTDDSFASGLTLERLEKSLRSQMTGLNVIYEYDKSNFRYQSVSFKQDIATVVVITQTVFDGPAGYFADGVPVTRQRQVVNATDTIVLQKIDGVWKIFYASLSNPAADSRDYY